MHTVEEYLPTPLREDIVKTSEGSGAGVNIGDLIIHSEDVLHNSNGDITHTLISQEVASTYSSSQYPLLYDALGTTELLAIDNAEGSEVPYKRVADYTEESS